MPQAEAVETVETVETEAEATANLQAGKSGKDFVGFSCHLAIAVLLCANSAQVELLEPLRIDSSPS